MSSQIPPTPLTVDERHDTHEERPPIAVEANFLRLPLFALSTKGLRNLDGFECKGTTTRGNNTWEFQFRTARSTATLYPGPLSRSIHLAFLSLITEQKRPLKNPVTWTWRNLCVRLGVQPSGRTFQRLKKAIEATAGLTIYSSDALYSKPTGQQLDTSQATHLYDRVVFVNGTMPDGRVADANYLWLSQWYLDNLNSFFTAPLDHDLWRFLDKRSPIASRLYEFLLINFYSGTPQLKINYPRLAQFLPVRPELYLSDARKQLEPAFQLLTQTHVTSSVGWQKRKPNVAQLRFDRGSRLLRVPSTQSNRLQPPNDADSISVREIHRTPEQELVGEFYRLWADRLDQRPTAADLKLAKRLISLHGRSKAKALLPTTVQQLKQHWPTAKTFVAIEKYLDIAIEHEQRQKLHDEQRRRQSEQEQAEARLLEQQRNEQQQLEMQWQPSWDELPVGEQDTIRNRLLQTYPSLRYAPYQLHFRCLQELARRTPEDGHAPETGNRT